MYENLTYEQYLALYSSINPAGVNAAVAHWNDVSNALSTVSQALATCRDGLLQSGAWTGDGATSFGAYMDALVQQTSGLSSAAMAMSANVSLANSMVDPATSGDFPPQPPPVGTDSPYQQWQLPNGEVYTGTAAQLREMLTNEAYERVNLIAASYNSSAAALSAAQGWAPTPSPHIDTPVPNPGDSTPTNPYGGTDVSSGHRSSGVAPVVDASGGAAGYQRPAVRSTTTATSDGYKPQPEFGPLMVPQGGPAGGTGAWSPAGPNVRVGPVATVPSSAPWTTGTPAGYAPGPYSGGGVTTGPGVGRGAAPVTSRNPGRDGIPTQTEEPGIIGGEVGPGTIRRPGSGYTQGNFGDGIVGGMPVNGGGRSTGRSLGGNHPGRAGVGDAEDGAAEGSFGGPRVGGSATGSRLNASLPEEGAVGRPAARAAWSGEPEPHVGMPMYPGGGMGAGAGREEQQRGKRPKYLVQNTRDWIPEPKVVPPVIE